MSEKYDHGPLLPYQITWRSGHVETIMAHQVQWPHDDSFDGALSAAFGVKTERQLDPRVKFHGEVDGRWQLLLVADEKDILSVRRLFGVEAEAAS